MKKAKYILLSAGTLGQILGVLLLFVNIKAAIAFYGFYIIATILVFVLLIKERRDEKREDDKNDYSDY